MLKNKRTYLVPVVGFALIILFSSILLTESICNYKDISFKDAMFAATSGLTTTGLTKQALSEQFNFLGQLIIAILMEIGALGFIIIISYIWSIKGKELKVSDIILIKDNISLDSSAMIKEQSIFIGRLMLKVQLIGTILLSIRFVPLFGLFKGVWYGIFHTISAFSNTGFTLFDNNSFIDFSNDIYVQVVLIGLMVMGGLGMYVIQDLKNFRKKGFSRLKLQTKIVLVVTLILLVLPTLLLKILEPNLNVLNSLFMASTTRSTGFTITPVKDLAFESKVILMILMLIGGAPASTTGGIKIIPVTIIIVTIISTLKGRNETVIFGKRIPDSTVKKSFTILMLFTFILFVCCMLFAHFENVEVLNIIFDSISAITNTGLSITDMGILTTFGESLMMILMFIGRVGPLSMILIFVRADTKNKYIEYPKEDVVL